MSKKIEVYYEEIFHGDDIVIPIMAAIIETEEK